MFFNLAALQSWWEVAIGNLKRILTPFLSKPFGGRRLQPRASRFLHLSTKVRKTIWW